MLFRSLYALPAWGVFASVGQSGRIDAFLKRAYKFGFSKDIITFNELLTKSGSSLFLKMQSSVHCFNYLLPPKKITSYKLRTATAATFFHSVILVFLSVHLLTGAFLCCNFYVCVVIFLSFVIVICILFMHVCCVFLNKV